MFSLSRIQFSKFAAMGSLVVLSTLGTPTRADELAQNLGPVGPHEAILTEIVHIDSAANESLNLQCGKNAETLTIIDTDSSVASGNTIQPPGQPLKASASGF